MNFQTKKVDVQRQRIRFIGRVQSVGFRFTAYDNAHDIGVTGWVRNELDGSVLMEVQGSAQQISSLIQSLDTNPYIRIDQMDVETVPTQTGEKDFRIMR